MLGEKFTGLRVGAALATTGTSQECLLKGSMRREVTPLCLVYTVISEDGRPLVLSMNEGPYHGCRGVTCSEESLGLDHHCGARLDGRHRHEVVSLNELLSID